MAEEDPFFDDIMRAMHGLRVAFLKHGMKPPISIEIGDYRDGDRIRYAMPSDMFMVHPRMNEGNPEWICNVMGVELRMPAQWRSEPGGKRNLV